MLHPTPVAVNNNASGFSDNVGDMLLGSGIVSHLKQEKKARKQVDKKISL